MDSADTAGILGVIQCIIRLTERSSFYTVWAGFCQFSIKNANDRSAAYSRHSLGNCRIIDAMHSF